MKEITIVFTKSKKKFPIISWLIRLWTWKSYSHVAVKFETKHFKSATFYQASEGLVNYMSEKQFIKKHEIVKTYKIKIPISYYGKIKLKCHELAGADYGLMQNIGICLVDALKLIGIEIKNPWKKDVNCSELIYEIIIKKLFPDIQLNPDTIKPHHIERLLKKIN